MKREKLREAVTATKSETHDALQLVWDATNRGQRNKLLKNEKIKALMERYDVNTEDES